ncbi:hypothetical protein VYA_14210 [Vibrio alfacsensis]|nr:hypothetical protein VYA_14210 [Vibrio alfacsensis]
MDSSDSGDSNRDDLTHDNTPTFALGNIDSDVAGEAIVVMKDGQVVDGTLENVNGTWQFTPTEAWADGEYDLTVQVTDTAGNSATSDALTVTIDTEAAATITIDDITDDNIINAAESNGQVTITGSVGGDAKAGDTVTLTVNGQDYTGLVQNDGSYSIEVDGSDLVSDADRTIVASVTGTDEAGNEFIATTDTTGDNKDGDYDVDTGINKPNIDLMDSSDSGDSNRDDLTHDNTPTFALGNIDSDVAGEAIVVMKDGQVVDGTLENVNGTWQFTPTEAWADGEYDLTVQVTDTAGNSATSDALMVTIDTEAAATITIDDITDDNIINAAESNGQVTITGSVGGDAKAGDTVTLTVNGQDYTGLVQNDGSYSIEVDGSDLVSDADRTILASVTGTDEAGNEFIATTDTTGDNKDGDYDVDTGINKPNIDLMDSSDSGDSNRDDLTHDNTPTFALGNIDSDVAGEAIVVMKDGQVVDGTLENVNGTWQFTPTEAWADGEYDLTVQVTDTAGNSATSDALTVTIDTEAAATITIDDITDDNIINAAESNGQVTITGSVGGDAKAGDTVTLTVNGQDYTGLVQNDGSYSIEVDGSDLVSDADRTILASVTGTDEAGNEFIATTDTTGDNKDGDYDVDTGINKPNIDLMDSSDTGDSNRDDLTHDNTPTFALGNIDSDVAGEAIVVMKDGQVVDGTLENVNGTWQFTPTEAWADGEYDLTVQVTDTAGNSATSDALTVTIDTEAAATITIDDITDDNIINAAESNGQVTITGSVGGDAKAGDTVTLTVNGQDYTGLVQNDGSYSIEVDGSDLVSDADRTIVASVTGTDEAGNEFIATTDTTGDNKDGDYDVDTGINKPNIDLMDSSDSGDSNRDDLTHDNTPTFALGNIDSDVAGEAIVVMKDGQVVDGTLENVNGTWQFTPTEAWADGEYDLTVQVTDTAGNSATSDALTVTIDTEAAATITIDDITDDNIINAAESNGQVTITGSVGGDAKAGDTVTLTVNGQDYTGLVQNDGSYSIEVDGSDLVSDADRTIVASVTGTDEAGNEFIATTDTTGDNKDGDYDVDTGINKPNIDLMDSSDSGDSNRDDLTHDNTPTFALGNIDSDVAGEAIVVMKDGQVVDGTLENVNGTWQFTPTEAWADGEYDLTVQVTDTAGNSATSDALTVTIDTEAAATITIDDITDDNIINAAESNGQVTITGSVGGDAKAGDTVTLTVNGQDYTGLVQNDGSYSIEVDGSDLVSDADRTIVASVTGTDEAGNEFIATTDTTGDNKDGDYDVDTGINKPNIDLMDSSDSGDSNRDDLTHDNTPTFALGNIDSDVAGEAIVVMKDGQVVDGTLENVNGTWQFTPTEAWADGEYDLTVQVTDTAGNSATSDALMVTIDTEAAATITIDDITDDNIINAAESNGQVTITGSVGGDAKAGDTVTLTVNGQDYTGLVQNDGSYSIEVDGSDLVSDADRTILASVTGTDEAGNEFIATTDTTGDNKDGDYDVDTGINKPNIDLMDSSDSGDSNRDDLTHDNTPTFALGNIDSDVAGEAIVVMKDGQVVDGTLENVNGTWQFTPTEAWADGEYDLTVQVTDTAGNSATSDALTVTIDTEAAATITIDDITDDNIINAAESNGQVTITGSVGGDAKAGDTVTLTVNGQDYTGLVQNDGSYSIEVDGSDLVSDADRTILASVTGTDEAGNEFIATTDTTGDNKDGDYDVDTGINKPNIDLMDSSDTGDSNRDDLTHDNTPTFALGNIDSDVAGEAIVVMKDGQVVDGTLENVNGTWQFTPTEAWADGEYDLTVQVTDTAGNSATSDALTVTIDTEAAATITIDDITDDNIINAAESNGQVTITGSVGGDAKAGDTVTLTVNGQDYTGLVQNDGSYSIEVDGSDLVSDADRTIVASVTGTDEAGNEFIATTDTTGDNKDGDYDVDTGINKPNIDLMDSSDSGDSNRDDLTHDNTPTFALGNIDSDVAGEAIVVMKDGQVVDGTLENVNGTWQFTPTEAWADGEYDLTVQVTDTAGNSATSDALMVTIDTEAAATITIDDITDDNIINAAESNGQVTITGSVGGDAKAGDTVTLTVNGQDYTGLVQNDGSYSIEVDGSDLVSDADRTILASVTGTDEAGNEFIATTDTTGDNKDGDYDVDTGINKPNIDLMDSSDSGDSNRDDLTHDNTPTFALGNIDSDVAGEAIVVMKDGQVVDGTLENVNGTWQFTPTEAWADGEYDLTVQVTDTAGNSATSDALTVTIDTEAAATITIDDITDDNIINAAESNGQVTITGSVGGDAKAGDTVTLTVNGQDYTGLVQNDGSYSIEVDGSDLVSDADRTILASVTGTDEAGNEFIATTDTTGDNKDGDYDVDTGINKPNIDLMDSSDTGDSNRDDLTHDNTPTFALGNIDSDVAGEAIVVMKDGQVVDGTLENVNGTWQFTPTEAWADGEYDLTVQVTDTAGNSATSDALTVTIDTEAAATITIDDITDDNIINAAESNGQVTITGSVGGDAKAGDTVTLTVNGQDYTGLVQNDGSYSIEVDGSDLVSDADRTIVASVTGTDEAGNEFIATTDTTGDNKDGDYDVDTGINKPNIDLMDSSDTGDSNRDDLTHDNTPTFALGNIDSDVAGEAIVVMKDGQVVDGTLENVNGTWQFTPTEAWADGEYDLTVQVTDTAGNSATSDALTVTIDTEAAATITIDDITDDNIINAAESNGQVTITGSVGGDAKAGDTVTLTVNGQDYTGLVQNDGSYSIEVDGSDLVSDADRTILASVTGTDEAGNEFIATTDTTGDNKDGDYDVDTGINKPNIDLMDSSDSGDSNRDDLTHDNTPTFALGNIDSDVAGEAIVVMKDGQVVDGTLENVNGTWQFTPTEAWADGEYDLTVQVTDTAGNSATSDALTVTIDTEAAATITIDDITDDNIINAAESNGQVTITGSVGGDAKAGDTVTLTVNGQDYTGLVQNDGSYSIEVDGSDLVSDADRTIVASVTGTDEAGNEFIATTDEGRYDVQVSPPNSEDFSINIGESGSSKVIFDDGKGSIEGDGSDHISDEFDDSQPDTQVGVVITELPDNGTLTYDGVEITVDDLAVFDDQGNVLQEGTVFENPNLIEYTRDEHPEGFLLGVRDEQDVDNDSPSKTDFYNWGEATDDPSVRKLILADGDVITITADKEGQGSDDLIQYNSNANHVGYGVGVGKGNGIEERESITINFESRPADSITLGLDGLGGYFEKGLDDRLNNGSSNESKVTIDVTWLDANGNRQTTPFEYQKETKGNSDLFHEIVIPSEQFELPNGAMIESVELSTVGNGNWELRYIDTRSDDSFDYRAVDSHGNYSDESTVTINNAPDAVDDPQGYTVQLGSFADNQNWQVDGVEIKAFIGHLGDRSEDIERDIETTDRHKLGVDGDISTGPGEQLQYDRETGQSEKLEITLPKPATSFSFAVASLYANEGGTENHEQGMWTAYLDGKPVQSGVFSLESGKDGQFSVDLESVAFDSIVFEATEFTSHPDKFEGSDNDSSDYFLTGFEATGAGAYAVNQSEGEIRIPMSEILANDVDIDGDTLTITAFNEFGEHHVRIEGDEVVFDFVDSFHGETSFTYTITDGNGASDTATINVIVNPDVDLVSVSSVNTLGTEVEEGESLTFVVNLSAESQLGQQLEVDFGTNVGELDAASSADVKLGELQFTNGVTYNANTGLLFVPPGVESFEIIAPTVDDILDESSENYTISVGGKESTGVILDNDESTAASSKEISGIEDTVLLLSLDNFGAEPGSSIVITGLPLDGKLVVNKGTEQTPNWVELNTDTITSEQLESGLIGFKPEENESGSDDFNLNDVGNKSNDYAEIKFKAVSENGTSEEHTLTVDITPVADGPSISVTLGDMVKSDATSSHHADVIATVGKSEAENNGLAVEMGLDNSLPSHLGNNNDYSDTDTLFVGGNNVDSMYGGGGDDVFVGGAQNDSFYGDDATSNTAHDGTDTVYLTGKFEDYKFTFKDNHGGDVPYWIVLDTKSVDSVNDHTGQEDRGDHLYEIERVVFSDKVIELNPDGTYEVLQDSWIPVDIDVDLVDTDGSESLVQTVTVNGLPEGIEVHVNGKPIAAEADGSFIVPTDADGKVSFDIKVPFDYDGSLDFPMSVTATSVESSNSDSASSTETVDVTAREYAMESGSHGNDTIDGSDNHDLIVGDVQGIEIVAGEDYNIAFVLDTSGSMGSQVGTAKQEILDVFDKLQEAANQGTEPGTVNILLTEFESQSTLIVSVDLSSATARDDFVKELNKIENSGWGNTNYESGLQSAVDWFGEQPNPDGQNITYFITDGNPNTHTDLDDLAQNDFSKVILDVDSNGQLVTLETIVNDNNYSHGQAVSYKGNILIDQHGYVYSPFTGQQIGAIDLENGELEYDDEGGKSVQTQHMYQVLAALSTVEAIGIGTGVSDSTLQQYDTDGVVDSKIDVSKLAETILGQDIPLKQGSDTIHGGEGNDILLGDLVEFGANEQGLSAIQSHVASQTGQDISSVDAEDIHNYVKDNIQEFNQDHTGDKTDYLYGDEGDDIIFGHGGNDILVGGAGNDILVGGDGDDIFQFVDQGDGIRDGEMDIVKDFTSGEDKLDLSELLDSYDDRSMDDVLSVTLEGSDDLKVTISDGDESQSIVLENAASQFIEHISDGNVSDSILNDLLKVQDTFNS